MASCGCWCRCRLACACVAAAGAAADVWTDHSLLSCPPLFPPSRPLSHSPSCQPSLAGTLLCSSEAAARPAMRRWGSMRHAAAERSLWFACCAVQTPHQDSLALSLFSHLSVAPTVCKATAREHVDLGSRPAGPAVAVAWLQAAAAYSLHAACAAAAGHGLTVTKCRRHPASSVSSAIRCCRGAWLSVALYRCHLTCHMVQGM